MEAQIQRVTHEIPYRGIGYLIFRHCAAAERDRQLPREIQSLEEQGAKEIYVASTDPEAPLAEGAIGTVRLTHVHDMLEMERDDEGEAKEPSAPQDDGISGETEKRAGEGNNEENNRGSHEEPNKGFHGESALRLTMNHLPETSCNIGMVYMEGSRICIHCNCRSSYGSKKRWLQEKCRLLAACHGRTAYSVLTDYPEWEFNPDSRLARLICREYRAQTGEPLLVERSHGGNECGAFFKAFPDADIVCTGTQIIGAHTPDESVLVSIVQKEWEMLCLTLKGMLEY